MSTTYPEKPQPEGADNHVKVSSVSKRVDQLDEGTIVAEPVFNSNGTRLFSKNKRLTGRDIDRLKRWNIRRISIWPQEAIEEFPEQFGDEIKAD